MNKYNTFLRQMLDVISRSQFNNFVKSTNTEKHAKGLSSWQHFLTLVFAQLSSQLRLRGIQKAINSNPKFFIS